MNEGEGSVQCTSCGATVHGPPGAMKCPYCGMRVDIPMSAAQERAMAAETEEERRRARMHDRYEDARDDDAPVVESSSNAGAIVGGVIAVAVVAIVIGAVASSRHKTSSSTNRKTNAGSVTTSTRPTTTATTRTYDSVPVTSCRCAFGDGQSTPLITLTPVAAPSQDPTRALALDIRSRSGFVSSSGSSPLALPGGTALTPLDGGDLPPHMGVACDTGVYVLVVDRTATAWSSVNAKWKWNASLPAAFADMADASAPPLLPNTSFGGYCTPITVTNGNASITLAGGKHATLSLKDGKVR
jgi:uncharacterized Zn finger protein (UPF0148 family)